MKIHFTSTRLALALLCIGLQSADAQSLSSEFRKNGSATTEIFEPQRQVLQKSSALIYRGHKRMVFGTIISADGYILTKASEITEEAFKEISKQEESQPLSVRVGENVLYEDVEVVSINTGWDVALLKIPAKGLKPVNLAPNSEIEQGTWVVANGASSRHRRRVKVGIISANTREIEGPVPVVMGVRLKEKENQLHVDAVTPKLGAEEAGVLKGDIILEVEGKSISTRKALQEILLDKEPKDVLQLRIKRGEEEVTLSLTLKKRPSSESSSRMNRNDMMSGRFSKRRDSFDRVLQVDMKGDHRSCGGPLITLDGKCVGMIIARADRAATYAIPVEELKELIKDFGQAAQ